MAIVRWQPYGAVASLQNSINKLFNDAFARTNVDEDFALSAWKPVVDIFDKDDAIVIHAELPGVKKEDVAIEVKDNVLTLRGERSESKEIKEDKYYRKERTFGSFHRAFSLPSAINPDTIKATFKDGILEIEIPKPEEQKPKQVKISID
ncbi:Hsp20/alpha crystallin family protein [Desulfatirhabdium butyrativorans]|uniref:Hsp20/alpha crystallin family protein n=1 Tax=Desulfatirhabdium butyrativorans TaxID=340467 RepID=UPI000426C2A9|nr:Hsp20/alpha crystallin family protein [Desulfatirhabdium butyrativorans]